MDTFSNFAYGTLASGISDVATTANLTTGHGARFPASGFNVVIWDTTYASPTAAYHDGAAEIVRVTSRTDDALTITRAQEGTAAIAHNTAGRTYAVAQTFSKKTYDEIVAVETALAAKAPTASPTFTGRATFSGYTSIAQTTMSGTEIAVTQLRQALTVSSSPTLTFAAGAVAGDVFGVHFIESGGVDRTITIPSSYSANRGAAITSFTLPANARNYVQWYYDGTTYFVAGDPVTPTQQRTALSLGGAALLNVGTSAGTVAAGDDARLSDARTPTAHEHSAADITSGTLAVARGGTGTSTPSLVAGSNITVTGTWPNQTINSTGGSGGGGGTFSMDDGDSTTAATASFDDGDAATA
jgi:hypothetical protein